MQVRALETAAPVLGSGFTAARSSTDRYFQVMSKLVEDDLGEQLFTKRSEGQEEGDRCGGDDISTTMWIAAAEPARAGR